MMIPLLSLVLIIFEKISFAATGLLQLSGCTTIRKQNESYLLLMVAKL